MAGELGHDVRVLVCDGCGAPLRVPVQGGIVQCEYCRATLEVIARREESMGRAHGGSALDEEHRLAILRLQDGKPLLPPDDLRALLAAGSLAATREREAHERWQAARSQLRTRYSADVEHRFYFLTLLLAEHHWAMAEYLRSRAILESAVETYRGRRHRQVALCSLARHAAVLEDRESALAWLAPCDPAALDLHMDTAYRYTRAFLYRQEEQFDAVLRILGRSRDDVPVADHSDELLAMYRADALERVEGPDAAASELVRWVEKDPFAYFTFVGVRGSSPFELCPRAFDMARSRIPLWNRKLGCKSVGCLVPWLGVVGALVVNGFLAAPSRPMPAIAGWIVAAVVVLLGAPVVGILALVEYRMWRKRTARGPAKERTR